MFNKRARSSAVLVICGQFFSIFPGTTVVAQAAFAADAHQGSGGNSARTVDMAGACKLYQQKNYTQAADAFETLIRTQPPNARLYYYAALANQGSERIARARQLFEYLVNNFPGTEEAKYAQPMISNGQAAANPTAPERELPESVKNALPKEMQALLTTEAGKLAVKQALMQQDETKLAAIRKSEAHGVIIKTDKIKLADVVPKAAHKRGDHPFSSADIARDGARGIDQFANPNCWFEASMAALAELPRGQNLIASMIRNADKSDYIVRFPNDGVEYVITSDDLEKSGIKDKALWASIIDCAETKKFPDNAGANGENNEKSRLDVGLGCITGCKAEIASPANCSIPELSSFIDGAVRSRNPIVAATWPDSMLPIDLVIGSHAYTVVDFDPAKALVTMRNPHGRNSRRFRLMDDPHHEKFEQLDDGMFRISLPLFQKCFHQICRSFI